MSELSHVRELVETLSIRLDLLQVRLEEALVGSTVRIVPIHFSGEWPKRQKWAANPKPRAIADFGLEGEGELTPLRPTPGMHCMSLRGNPVRPLGMTAFGLPEAPLQAIINQIARRQRLEMNFIPIFVTDCPSFVPFRRYGFVFEYMASAAGQPAVEGTYTWEEYVIRRMEAIKRKWDIPDFFDLGRSSPLERKQLSGN